TSDLHSKVVYPTTLSRPLSLSFQTFVATAFWHVSLRSIEFSSVITPTVIAGLLIVLRSVPFLNHLGGLTVTGNQADAFDSCPSVAVQVSVVFPIGKVAPDSGEQTMERTTSSVLPASTVKLTFVPAPLAFPTVMFAGTVIVGGVSLNSSAPMSHAVPASSG